MTRPIVWRASAQDDLLGLHDWIAGQAGLTIALNYTAAIEGHVAKLSAIPEWGPARPDLGPGIRTISYRRRTTIAYRILDDAVEIVRLAHGGRDLGRIFAEDNE